MQRPTDAELAYLHLAYNRFYDIYDEVLSPNFWDKDNAYRFAKIKDAFSVYTELLAYEPIQGVIEYLRRHRPPMEAEIGSDVFKVVRNIITHFPVFENWDEVFINKSLVNWNKPGQTIDKFMMKYDEQPPVKYRFWQPDIKKMTYISIGLPKGYAANKDFYLKELLTEKDGVIFSLLFMRRIMDTQVESSS